VLAAEDRFAPVGGGILLLGIALGIVAALVGGFNLTAPWLLIAYVLSAIGPIMIVVDSVLWLALIS
jgi:hypothetical protein